MNRKFELDLRIKDTELNLMVLNNNNVKYVDNS